MASEVYEGRLVADGNGNLLADERKKVGTKSIVVKDENDEIMLDDDGNSVVIELPVFRFGKNHGKPVAYDEDKDRFVFVKPGEPSHNERHHQKFAETVPTQDQDSDQPGYAGTKSKPTEGNEHHFGPSGTHAIKGG